MFQSENEDLVPRCAPKPSASDGTGAEFRPSVPEISIVFNQRESRQSTCTQPNVITPYSVWKNKCMPTVALPTEVQSFNNELPSTSKRSNVYPMRAEAVLAPHMSYSATAGQVTSNKNEYSNKAEKNTESSTQVTYSIEPPTAKFSQMGALTVSGFKKSEISVQQKQSETILSKTLKDDVLTICAGTQTENSCNNTDEHISDSVTKNDIAEVKSMIAEMAKENRRLLEIIQNLLQGKLSLDINKPKLKDVSTQNYGERNKGNMKDKPSHTKYYFTDEDLTKKEDYEYQHKSTPQPSKMQEIYSAPMSRLPKPETEQSMVMNELAVKYLPNGELNHMPEEVAIGLKVQNQYASPLKNKENLDKNPTDLSTASYKYLRKYRLLPEENLTKFNFDNKQEHLLDLEVIRCKPKFM